MAVLRTSRANLKKGSYRVLKRRGVESSEPMGETVNSMLTRLVAYLAVAIAVGLLFLAGASVYQLMWPRPVVPFAQMSR